MGVLENAPGPSPWYLRRGNPLVPRFKWEAAGESGQTAGAMVLAGHDGAVLILDFHNYVVLLDSDTLLVWHQRGVETGPTAPVVLRIFRLSELRPLEEDLETLCGSMRHAEAPFASSVLPLCEFPIPTDVAGAQRVLTFLEQLHRLSELLILCHSSGVEESPPGERSNLALLIARPSDGTYQLFPQDWFNFAKLDYTFQGVTRVARDARTGRIHGEGVRIAPFVLDDTLRHTLSARRLKVEHAVDALGRWLQRRGRLVCDWMVRGSRAAAALRPWTWRRRSRHDGRM
jgi:hypothetical protein